MHDIGYFNDVLILLGVSVFILVLMGKLKISPVLGYLVVGATIGDHGLNLIKNQERAELISDVGVIFLLFVIGLELSFERLIKMRMQVFGFGGLQILVTTLVLALIALVMIPLKIPTSVIIVIAAALSLSSTAVVIQVLTENKKKATQAGITSFATLLMQDLAVVPLLSIVPVLSAGSENIYTTIGFACVKAMLTIASMTIMGRLLLRPFLRIIGSVKKDEVYVTTTLLLVLGAASITGYFELSPAMGAFLSGLLIAETEYRTRVEESIMPFQGLFMALFFLTVGMSIDIRFIIEHWFKIVAMALGLISVKASIIFFIGYIFKIPKGPRIYSALLLSQGGEFAFILFSMLTQNKIINPDLGQMLLMIVTCSMAITPLLSIIGAKMEERISFNKSDEKITDKRSELSGHVIIAGFGKEGRVVAYMMQQHQMHYVAIDSNAALVRQARSQGFNVYHGDATKEATLTSAGGENALALVLSIKDKFITARVMKTIARKIPSLRIISRVDDYHHARAAYKLGAVKTVPTIIESGIQLGGATLEVLGSSEDSIINSKERIRRNDYCILADAELFKGAIVKRS